MTSLLTGLALCCLLAHARGLRRFSYPFSLAVPSPFLSLSLTTLVHNRSTRLRRSQCARANARCNGNDGRDNTDALSHAYTFTQSRIEHRLRSLSEFNDPSTRPSRARPSPPPLPVPVVPFPYSATHSRSRVLRTQLSISR